MIACSYTPICVAVVGGIVGWAVFAIQLLEPYKQRVIAGIDPFDGIDDQGLCSIAPTYPIHSKRI